MTASVVSSSVIGAALAKAAPTQTCQVQADAVAKTCVDCDTMLEVAKKNRRVISSRAGRR